MTIKPALGVAVAAFASLVSGCGSGNPPMPAAPSGISDASAGSGDAARGGLQVSGTVARVSGTCPALRFLVGGVTVDTDRATVFSPGTCANVVSGAGVVVIGTRSAANTMAASSVAVRGTTSR